MVNCYIRLLHQAKHKVPFRILLISVLSWLLMIKIAPLLNQVFGWIQFIHQKILIFFNSLLFSSPSSINFLMQFICAWTLDFVCFHLGFNYSKISLSNTFIVYFEPKYLLRFDLIILNLFIKIIIIYFLLNIFICWQLYNSRVQILQFYLSPNLRKYNYILKLQ